MLLLNLQNEVVDPKGHIGARGNARQIAARGTLENVAALLRDARRAGLTVIHVSTVYDSDYSTLNRSAPQFATAAREGRLRAGSWEAQFHPLAAPRPGEPVLRRGGVGLFATTDLHARLPTPDRTHILIAGVSTRLVVEAAVFELTDRGYAVTVLEDCCAAQTADAHDAALKVLSRFGRVQTAAEALAYSAAGGTTEPR